MTSIMLMVSKANQRLTLPNRYTF